MKRCLVHDVLKVRVVIILFLLILFNLVYSIETETGDYIHYRLAVKYKSEKKYDAAIDEFRKVLAAYPDNYNAYMHIAEIRSIESKPRLVIYNLKKALNYNPGWGKAHKLLADAYEKDGQFQKAIIEIQQYQQTSDPAERDSLQLQIDRLIRRVSGDTTVVDNTESASVVSTSDSSSGTVQSAGVKMAPLEDLQKNGQEQSDKPKSAQAVKTTTVKAGSSGTEKNFADAVTAYNDNNFDESLRLLKEVLRSSPGHEGAYYYGGLIRMKMGQPDLAKINFLRAVTFPELGHNSHFYLAKIFAEKKNFTEAIRQLEFYLAKTQYEVGKKEALALIESYKRELVPAELISTTKTGTGVPEITAPERVTIPIEKYSQVEIRIDSLLSMLTVDTLSDVGRQLLEGIKLFKDGMYDEAIRAFKNVLAANPTGAAAMHCIYNSGISYFKLGLYKEAENQFKQILERFAGQPVAAQSLFFEAMTYLQRGEPAVAEKLFRKFIQEYRHHSWTGKTYEMLGDAYVDLEQTKKAIDSYLQAVSIESAVTTDRVVAQFKLGTTYLLLGNQTRALQAFKAAIELGEKHTIYLRIPDSYYRIADEYYKSKDYDNALEYYTHVTRKYPAFQETPWGLFQIGSIYKNKKEYQNAVKVFKDLIKSFPDDYWAKQAQWKLEDSIWENEYKAVLR